MNSYQFKELNLPNAGIVLLHLINNYPAISHLDLSGNKIADISQLVNLPHLVKLNLNNNLLKSYEPS